MIRSEAGRLSAPTSPAGGAKRYSLGRIFRGLRIDELMSPPEHVPAKIRATIERAGLEPCTHLVQSSLPVLVHKASRQEFVLVPAGSFVMGMTAEELVGALREVDFDPDIEFWREAHRRRYAAANPARAVTVSAFLCGRSPLLVRTLSAIDPKLQWSVSQTAEHRGKSSVAMVAAEAAQRALEALGWSAITEAQWEYVARCGGTQVWAETGENVERLVNDQRYATETTACNPWGIWGLGLGEWIADEWHASYDGAPCDGSAWSSRKGPPGSIRGGAVLHAPWQDAGERLSCHAAARAGDGGERGTFAVRPVIHLESLGTPTELAHAPEHIPFEEAVGSIEAELRAKRTGRARAEAARLDRDRRLLAELPGSVQQGIIRSVGDDGVYVVRLSEANAILRLGAADARLSAGTKVTVRVVGSGGVPDAELVEIIEK